MKIYQYSSILLILILIGSLSGCNEGIGPAFQMDGAHTLNEDLNNKALFVAQIFSAK
jgi:hypothetical protein